MAESESLKIQNDQADRRQNPRFVPVDTAFAVMRPDFDRIGGVKDISLGGLCFEYLGENPLSQDLAEVDLFLSSNGFYLQGLPCRVVYDRQARDSLLPGLQHRRCGIEFGVLSGVQRRNLRYFLNKHVVGNA